MDQHRHKVEMKEIEGGKSPIGTVEGEMLTYYTCPMESHAFVRSSEPGKCPECGTTLIRKTEKYDPDKAFYTCPMPEHSYVVSETPGKCPVCEMELVELAVK